MQPLRGAGEMQLLRHGQKTLQMSHLHLINRFPCRELRVYGEKADRLFPDAETMIRWIDQPCLVPFLPCVAPSDRKAFRAEVIKRMVQATRQPDGRCFELFRRVHVFFRK